MKNKSDCHTLTQFEIKVEEGKSAHLSKLPRQNPQNLRKAKIVLTIWIFSHWIKKSGAHFISSWMFDSWLWSNISLFLLLLSLFPSSQLHHMFLSAFLADFNVFFSNLFTNLYKKPKSKLQELKNYLDVRMRGVATCPLSLAALPPEGVSVIL